MCLHRYRLVVRLYLQVLPLSAVFALYVTLHYRVCVCVCVCVAGQQDSHAQHGGRRAALRLLQPPVLRGQALLPAQQGHRRLL